MIQFCGFFARHPLRATLRICLGVACFHGLLEGPGGVEGFEKNLTQLVGVGDLDDDLKLVMSAFFQ